MAPIKVKGYEFDAVSIRDSHDRRAVQIKNKIIGSLGRIGLTEDDIDVPLESGAFRFAPAGVTWYIEGHRLHYSFQSKKFVENLYVVSKVIELEVNALLEGTKNLDEFIRDFSEDKDVQEQRLKARELLGVSKESLDFEDIDAKYKALARKYHPDMPEGSVEKFKEINNAHKILKRELQ